MADAVRVDSEGLQSHAALCDAAAAALPVPAPSAAGQASQATTAAIARAHALVDAVAAKLVTRVASTGLKLRTADGVYRTTDAVSARNLGAIDGPVEA